MENEKSELLEQLFIISTLTDENPCRMPNSIMHAISESLKVILGSHLSGGASREQAAKYLKRDVRTLSRWQTDYDDFPSARHYGHREVTYDWMELARWKLKHTEIYGER